MTNKSDKILAPIKKRVLEVIENHHLNKTEVFNILGVSSSNFRGPALFSEVSGDVVAKILTTFPNTNPDWLILGKGNSVRSNNPALEKVNWIVPNEISRFKTDKLDEEGLLRVGLRILIICENYNLQIHELSKLLDDDNVVYYIKGTIPVPEDTLDLILTKFPEISEKWLYTSFGPLKKKNEDQILKDYISTQKQLIEYKENEINQLKEIISELKKEKESSVYTTKVAESRGKLKK